MRSNEQWAFFNPSLKFEKGGSGLNTLQHFLGPKKHGFAIVHLRFGLEAERNHQYVNVLFPWKGNSSQVHKDRVDEKFADAVKCLGNDGAIKYFEDTFHSAFPSADEIIREWELHNGASWRSKRQARVEFNKSARKAREFEAERRKEMLNWRAFEGFSQELKNHDDDNST